MEKYLSNISNYNATNSDISVATDSHFNIHDDLMFSFERRHITEPISQQNTPVKRHHYYELIWVTQGKGDHLIDFHQHPLRGGQFFLIAPGQVHEWRKGAGFNGFTCLFPESLLDQHYHTNILKTARLFTSEHDINPIIMPENKEPLLNNLAHLLCNESQKEEHDIHIIQPLFMAFLYAMTSQPSETNSVLAQTNQVTELSTLIDEFYDKENNVVFYAQQLKMSIKQLNALAKATQGKTVSHLIQDRKYLEAKRSLLLSHESIKVIAYKLGFDDPSYFSRFFRRYSGVSPIQYRNETLSFNTEKLT